MQHDSPNICHPRYFQLAVSGEFQVRRAVLTTGAHFRPNLPTVGVRQSRPVRLSAFRSFQVLRLLCASFLKAIRRSSSGASRYTRKTACGASETLEGVQDADVTDAFDDDRLCRRSSLHRQVPRDRTSRRPWPPAPRRPPAATPVNGPSRVRSRSSGRTPRSSRTSARAPRRRPRRRTTSRHRFSRQRQRSGFCSLEEQGELLGRVIEHDPASAVTFVAIDRWQLADAVEPHE